MRTKLSAFLFILGSIATMYPLVVSPRFLVLGPALVTLVALIAALTWPRRVGALPWTFLLLATYALAVSLESGSLDVGAPLMGIASLLVLEGIDLLQMTASNTHIQPGLIAARLRHFGHVAALGAGTSVAMLAGSTWTRESGGAILAVAALAALSSVALSVLAINGTSKR